MENIKTVLKIILVIQIITCCLAYYGHPDAEAIDFSSPTHPSQEQAIIEAAIKRGMDGDAVAELLRTKKPVVRTVSTPDGFTKTTTYKLEDDGSISRKTVIQQRNRYVYNSGSVPDSIPINDLRKSPTGTLTRTFTDENGHKVTQTIGINKPKVATGLGTDDLSADWFKQPFASWPEGSSLSPPSSKSNVPFWFSDKNIEPSYKHRTITRTYTDPNGEKYVIHTTSNSSPSSEDSRKSKFTPISDIHWPSFDGPLTGPWDSTDIDDSDDWEVVEDHPKVEATTTKKFDTSSPKTWEWPEFTTTTTKPKIKIEPEGNTRKPLPSLEDFLKSQYSPTTTTAETQTNIPKTFSSTTAIPTSRTTKKPTIINIEDLPVVEILQNGKPANESIIKNLPPHLTPKIQTERVLKIENKYPIEEDINPKVETNIRTYTKTHNGPDKPKLKDLDPEMQEVLKRAGISPDDITNIEGDTITKTRTEPDGRIITTTYKVNTVPVDHTIPVHHYSSPHVSTYSTSYIPSTASHMPLTPFPSQLSPISEFLAKLGLTKSDITSRNGRYSKTFIDDNGDVLTATFVLSSPKGIKDSEAPRSKPYK